MIPALGRHEGQAAKAPDRAEGIAEVPIHGQPLSPAGGRRVNFTQRELRIGEALQVARHARDISFRAAVGDALNQQLARRGVVAPLYR